MSGPPGARGRFVWWRLGIGLGLLATLIFAVGPMTLAATFAQASIGWAAAVIMLLVPWLLLGGLNVWLLMRCLHPLAFDRFIAVYLLSWATSLLLPGQLGDSTQILFLRRYQVAVAKSGAAYLVDKSISLGWLLVIATWGIGLYTPLGGWWLPALGAGITAVGGLAAFLSLRLRPPPGGWLARLHGLAVRVIENLRVFRRYPGILALNFGLTLVKWLLMAFIFQWSFRAFGVGITFIDAATLPVMSSLVGYLPITLGGAGTMEWTAVALFGRLGVEAAVVASAFLMVRIVLLAGALLVLSFARIEGDGRSAARAEPSTEEP